MSAFAHPTSSSNTNGSLRKKSSHPRENGHAVDKQVEEDRVTHERGIWIQQRQSQLETVFDTHDTHIRELFQLDKFRQLLTYDPKEAKQDVSAVFQEFKGRFDLLGNSAVAGPSRQTRRAHTQRLESLKSSSISAPPALSIKKKKGAEAIEKQASTANLVLSKSTGKAPGASPRSQPSSISASAKSIGKKKALYLDVHDPPHESTPKRASQDVTGSELQPHPKRRRVIPMASITDPFSDVPHESVSAVLARRPKGRRRNLQRHDTTVSVPSQTVTTEEPSPSKTPTRRIKLIVRRPDPVFTNPRQKPPPQRHGGSITTFLSSYTTLDDRDVDEATLEQFVHKDAVVWERIDSLKRQGRFFPSGFRIDENSRGGSAIGISDHLVERPSQDQWAHVVDAVKERSLVPTVSGRQVGGQVASRIRAYWEGRAAKEDKVKLQEEKRLRALAKATMKLVINEWKKVVHHAREEERVRREDEERRRGHEHLDAILDQSGQILEVQQLDLTKPTSHSRSSSVSATLGYWASASPGLEDQSSSETEEGNTDGQDTSDESDDINHTVNSSFLLGDQDALLKTRTNSKSTKGSSSPTSSAPPFEDDFGHFRTRHRMRSQSTTSSREHYATTPLRNTSPNPLAPPEDIVLHPEAKTPTMAARGPHRQQHMSKFTRKSSPSTTSSSRSNVILDANDELTPDANAVDAWRSDSESRVERTRSEEPSSELKMDQMFSPEVPAAPMHDDVPLSPETRLARVLESEPIEEAHDDLYSSYPKSPDTGVPKDQPSSKSEEATVVPTSEKEDTIPHDDAADSDEEWRASVPAYLWPYAVAPVEWDPQSKVKAPFLLRGSLRPYQHAGLEWLASLHTNNLNGILADEMGLGKTIQTISLLAYLACDRGIWGPHLIIVPTSVLLNWEMEFKKFLPGFKVLSYHGNTKRRKELRQGWNNKYHFNVCVTSYTLASRDAHVFKRKPWYYMILDEAHMIKNFKSQRWNILLMFRSFRRLLLTGTPLQNNLTELWALLQFLMSGTNFANLKEFGEWFSNPLEKAIEMGTMDDETQQRVSKLHTVLRPYLLRRLKRDVEKELPQKYEHLVMCSLSKRQRYLYDEFMARAETRHDLQSGVYQKIANILMQLRKVVNHPDLFEVRPIVTSFVMSRSAIADFEIQELLIRRRLCVASDGDQVNLDALHLQFIHDQNTSLIAAVETHRLDGTPYLPMITEVPGEPPPSDTRTVVGHREYRSWLRRAANIAKWTHFGYLNRLRCSRILVYSEEMICTVRTLYEPLRPSSDLSRLSWSSSSVINSMIKSYCTREEDMADIINKFAFATPPIVARDMADLALCGCKDTLVKMQQVPSFDGVLHRSSVKLQIAFPDPSLLQYDCGKLQELARLLRERKSGGHRVLIFTQMTRILDILEIFLNFHGYLYLRLDGATKIEDRQYITERFNSDSRIFCFISSSRSGGVGINLTGADTVIFYDSDFNPQMDRQCEDRAHRIGQIRDVHIYRFVSEHTVEEALLRKANQKRSLDDIVIQKGEFDWRSLLSDELALTKALGEFEDSEDARAAAIAASEEVAMEGADEADFTWEGGETSATNTPLVDAEVSEARSQVAEATPMGDEEDTQDLAEDEDEAEEGGTIVEYMLSVVRSDREFFSDWRV